MAVAMTSIRLDTQLADEAAYALDELVRDAGAYAGGVELDPERLAEAQRRRDVVFRLLK